MQKMTALLLTVVLLLSAVCLADNGWTCPSCGAANDANFCTQCGTKKPQGSSCPFCGTAFNGNADFAFCPNCGGDLKAESSKSDAPSGNANGVISASLVNGGIGDTVVFGKYEQNAYMPDGKEDIEWIILDVDGSRKLLISKYGLDCVMYNDEWVEVTWATSSIRNWLNTTFLNTAFSADEQKYIVKTHLHTNDNISAHTKGGADTEDKVFFLSVEEANTYFSSDYERQLMGTAYAVARKAYIHEATAGCWWWLRTPGENQKQACMVMSSGLIRSESDYAYRDKPAVRPAVWVDVQSVGSNQVKKENPMPVKVGDVYLFGHYDQDNNPYNGEEDIEWIVLDVKGRDALLISKKGLECIRYSIKEYGITWESSALRTWMNDEFYNAAFTNSEKRQIKKSTVTADQNSLYDRSSGGVTQDYVFALSNYEAEHYFSGNSARICKPSNKAILNGAYVNPNLNSSWWWLRTPGKNATDVCSVNTDGSIDYNGGLVSSNKGVARPCIWITFD